MSLDRTDAAVVEEVVAPLLDEDDGALMVLGVMTSAIALDRWGRDLRRDAGEQEFAAWDEVVEATAEDVVDDAEDGALAEDLDVDAADLDRERQVSILVEAAERATATVEREVGLDRDSPGGLVEEVDR